MKKQQKLFCIPREILISSVCIWTLFLVIPVAGANSKNSITHPTTVQSVKAKVTMKGEGSITGSMNGTQVKMKILLFKETNNQNLDSLDIHVQINGRPIQEIEKIRENGNIYARFTTSRTGTIRYRIEAIIKTDYTFNTLENSTISEASTSYPEYQQPSKNVESDHQKIRSLSHKRFIDDQWLPIIREVTHWTNQYITYDWKYYPETFSALKTLETGRGVCDEYAGLAGALLRAQNVPVRFVSGIAYTGDKWGNHAWMEIFHPQHGWLPADPTYGEAVVVDGTHIQRGTFSDPEGNMIQSQFITTGPTTTGMNIKQKDPEVEILNVKTFSDLVEVNPPAISIAENRWVPLEITIKNRRDHPIIVPLMLGKVKHMDIKNRERSLLLSPNEERDITWKIKMNKSVPTDGFLRGSYQLITYNQIQEGNMKIKKSEDIDDPSGIAYRRSTDYSQYINQDDTENTTSKKDKASQKDEQLSPFIMGIFIVILVGGSILFMILYIQ